MSRREELQAKRDEIREARSKACSGIMDAETAHDNEAQQGHIADLDRLRIEEVEVLSELENLFKEDPEEEVK